MSRRAATAIAIVSLGVGACGGRIRGDDHAPTTGDDGSTGDDASIEAGLDAALDSPTSSEVILPSDPTVVAPRAVALVGVTPEDWAVVRDDTGALVATPLDGSTSVTIMNGAKDARTFDHVAFGAGADGTLVAWSVAGGVHVLSKRSSIVGAVASADGRRVAWLETHDGGDDYHVASADGSGATLVTSIPSSSPCVHPRAAAAGSYAIEATCEVTSPTYRFFTIDMERAELAMDVSSALYASVDARATLLLVVVGGRDGVLSSVEGLTHEGVVHDASSMGVFLPDTSAVLVPTGAKDAIVRIPIGPDGGTVSPLGVNGTLGYGDVAPDGATMLVLGPGGGSLLLSTTNVPPKSRSIGAGIVVVTGKFIGPFEEHASFTVDGAFVLFERGGGLHALGLEADPTSSVSLGAGKRVGSALPSHDAQVVFSLDQGASFDLAVGDARTPSPSGAPDRIGGLPSANDFALTRDRRHVAWIEPSGPKSGLNVAPLPAP